LYVYIQAYEVKLVSFFPYLKLDPISASTILLFIFSFKLKVDLVMIEAAKKCIVYIPERGKNVTN